MTLLNGFINSHTISQFMYSSNFKKMDGYFEKGDFSSGNGYMSIQTVYQHNGLI